MEKAQVIKCKCGKIFAACRLPECYAEADWMRDLRKYVKQGCTIELIDCDKFTFEQCVCEKEEKEEKIKNRNQLKLF